MSNSSLICYSKISPNKTSPRKHKIDTITIHCMAGNISIESCGDIFYNIDRKASSNYGIGSDGRIAMYVEESDRSWCSSNADNDNRAITIEVANDGGAETGWHISQNAYNSLIKLLVDICQRNGIRELLWKGDKSLIGQVDKQNMTVHRWFAPKACPGDYLYNMHGEIARAVNSVLKGSDKKFQNGQEISDKPKHIWDKFKRAGFSDVMAAAIMGNLYDESHFFSNNLQNSFEKKFKKTDEQYTNEVNSKVYPEDKFSRDGAGYGLAQWTYWTRKQGLYEFTIKNGFKIDDLDRQIEYIIEEITKKYSGLYDKLKASRTVKEASYLILTQYEKPADQGPIVQNRRYEYAKTYYNKYSVNGEKVNLPYIVRISIPDLNIRKGPGIEYNKTGKVTGIGSFTIVEEMNGWGLLKAYQKDRDGWISLDYVQRVK